MGRSKRETQPVTFHGETGIVPQKKLMERSPSAIVKVILCEIFDSSPATAFQENRALRGLSSPRTPSKKSLDCPPDQLECLEFVPTQQPEASNSVEVEAAVKHTSRTHSTSGSSQRSRGIFNVFKRRPSKSKVPSNPSSLDGSNRALSSNGEISSRSEVVSDSGIDTNEVSGTSMLNRLESEIQTLRRRLEKEEVEIRKLKDEVSCLRSSSGSSQDLSTRSDLGTPRSQHESSGSETFEGFGSVVSLSESSMPSTSDKCDSDSQTYMEFCPSDEGRLVKLVEEEMSRSGTSTSQVSENYVSLANAGGDVSLVRGSLLKEDLEHYCSEKHTIEHLDTFLSDAAALGKRGTFEKYIRTGCEYQGIRSQSPEGLGQSIRPHQSSEIESSVEVVSNLRQENCCSSDDTAPLQHVEDADSSKETGSVHVVVPSDDSLADEKDNHDESSLKFMGEGDVKGVKDERLESEELKGDPELLSQKFGGQPREKKSLTMSIMDYGVPADPEIAENRRHVQFLFQELEEKLMKQLRNPRYTSYSPTSASSSGTSSPSSIESASPGASFRESEHYSVTVDDCENGCFNGWCHPSGESLAASDNCDMQESKGSKDHIKDLDLELASPRDILVSKFQTGSFVKSGSFHPSTQSEICEEEVDRNSGVVREVYFHPTLSRFGKEAARLTLKKSSTFVKADYHYNHNYRKCDM